MLALDCRDCVETFPDTWRSACLETFLASHPGSGRLESRHALALGRGGTSSSQAGHKSREWEGGRSARGPAELGVFPPREMVVAEPRRFL